MDINRKIRNNPVRIWLGRLLTPLAAFTFPFMLTACNTVEGAGDDIEAAGDAISDTAEDAN